MIIPFPTDCPEALCIADIGDRWCIVARQSLRLGDGLYPSQRGDRGPVLLWDFSGALGEHQAADFRHLRRIGVISTVQRREGQEMVLYARRNPTSHILLDKRQSTATSGLKCRSGWKTPINQPLFGG